MKQLQTVEDIKKAMETNNNFEDKVYRYLYDWSMEDQSILCQDAQIEGLRYHDHYSSFYYTIEDRPLFLQTYYRYTEDPELEKLIEKEKTLSYMDYDNPNYDLLDSWLDKQAEKWKDKWESWLHSYENDYFKLKPGELGYDLLECMIDNGIFDDYYFSEIYNETPTLYVNEGNWNYTRV